jgi:hypothetical protein
MEDFHALPTWFPRLSRLLRKFPFPVVKVFAGFTELGKCCATGKEQPTQRNESAEHRNCILQPSTRIHLTSVSLNIFVGGLAYRSVTHISGGIAKKVVAMNSKAVNVVPSALVHPGMPTRLNVRRTMKGHVQITLRSVRNRLILRGCSHRFKLPFLSLKGWRVSEREYIDVGALTSIM